MSAQAKKATFLTSLGAGLEYYDFIIYGMMAEHLSALFFAESQSWIALLKTFAVFAIGYLMRPIGGILFGIIGDTMGHQKTFSVMLLMAISTFSIGILPTYAQVGPVASFLLILLRLLQGLSFGAELPGAITVVCEYTEKQKRATFSGFVISSVSLGSMLASLILFFLSNSLAKEQIQGWGWRIPFLFGGTLAIVNFFIRRNLQETPEFSRLQASRAPTSLWDPFITLYKGYSRKVILGMGLTWFAASLVIFSLYLPTFLSTHYKYASKDIYLAMTLGLLWSAISLPFCGRVADFLGKTKMLAAASFSFLIVGPAIFKLLDANHFYALIFFMVIYQTVISFITVSFLPLLSEIFPTEVRYTGTAACYNLTYSLMGCAPMAVTAMITYTHTSAAGLWFLLGSALVSGSSAILLAKRIQLPA